MSLQRSIQSHLSAPYWINSFSFCSPNHISIYALSYLSTGLSPGLRLRGAFGTLPGTVIAGHREGAKEFEVYIHVHKDEENTP